MWFRAIEVLQMVEAKNKQVDFISDILFWDFNNSCCSYNLGFFERLDSHFSMRKDLESALAVLAPSHLEVIDISDGCGQSWSVVVVSPQFENLKTIQRHKLVNSALKDLLPQIHAFSQKTLTPAEFLVQSANV